MRAPFSLWSGWIWFPLPCENRGGGTYWKSWKWNTVKNYQIQTIVFFNQRLWKLWKISCRNNISINHEFCWILFYSFVSILFITWPNMAQSLRSWTILNRLRKGLLINVKDKLGQSCAKLSKAVIDKKSKLITRARKIPLRWNRCYFLHWTYILIFSLPEIQETISNYAYLKAFEVHNGENIEKVLKINNYGKTFSLCKYLRNKTQILMKF